MVRTIIFAVMLVSATATFGADRTTKVRELMEAQGLLAMFAQQMELGAQQGRAQANQMLDQMLSSLSPTPEFAARFRKASDNFIAALSAPWSAQDLVDQWAIAYGVEFTDQELDQLLKYYRSPLGKKDVLVTQTALPKLFAYLAERSKPIAESATRKYIADLDSIAKECNCRK
ncbi:hypothetical protein BWI17_12300 [Betaproteobacteria bacterium GR16-43]|nr:hypothetical protein BWI17_12300 [Betaproteobacteria bacterium GR16-43]